MAFGQVGGKKLGKDCIPLIGEDEIWFDVTLSLIKFHTKAEILATRLDESWDCQFLLQKITKNPLQ